LLPALGGMMGLVFLWRRNWRLGVALASVLLLHAAATVLYFNIPADFFRPLDRHYLPVCVTFGITIAYGFGMVLAVVARHVARRRQLVLVLGALVLTLAPASQLVRNWGAKDASQRYFARDFATNMLRGLPRDAVLFTAGDNDTFPLWYVQAVEGVRPDVQIVNRSLANTFFFIDQILRRDPSFPISKSREERLTLAPLELTDTVLVVPVVGSAQQLGIPDGTPIPETMRLRVVPSMQNYLLPADQVLLDILRTNQWRRSLCFATTIPDEMMGGFLEFSRLDGLFRRIVPIVNPPVDPETLRENLLDTYSYEGYADATVRLDVVSRNMGRLYAHPFTTLIELEREQDSIAACREVASRYVEFLPSARLGEGVPTPTEIERMCGDGS
jgi:hypothetical protein